MTDLLFDVPWWLPTLLVIAGIAIWVRGNRRQERRPIAIGIGLIVLAVGWSLLSYFVDTPKETCQKQTRQFVQAVVDRDWNAFNTLCGSDLDFKMMGNSWRMEGRDEIVSMVKGEVEHIGLKSAHVSDTKASQDGNTITVSMTVWSNQTLTMERPIDSDWEMDWRRVGERWVLREVRATRVANLAPDEVSRSLGIPQHR